MPRACRRGSSLGPANATRANCVPSGVITGQLSVGVVPAGTRTSAGRSPASTFCPYDAGVPDGRSTGSTDDDGDDDGDEEGLDTVGRAVVERELESAGFG